VISLNPQNGPPGGYGERFTPADYWNLWRRHNWDHWYPKFFGPLTEVAGLALDGTTPATEDDQKELATNRMVFVELCPYASSEFSVEWDQLLELCHTDLGFFVAERFNATLLNEAQPGVVLINGNSSRSVFEERHKDRLNGWIKRRYVSEAAPQKQLHHWEGTYRTTAGTDLPVVGFPFLSTARGFNGHVECQQLGRKIRDFVGGSH